MGIEKTYRESVEILKPKDVRDKYHKVYKTIILTFQSRVLPGLLSSNLVSKIDDIEFGSAHSRISIYELNNHRDTLFFLSPIGSPMTVGTLEEICYVMGVENIVMYGTCGVLDKAIAAGKIIVPTKAYRDEGTSYHYLPASDFIEIKNSNIVSKILKEANIDYVKGITWTTDAFYRETQQIFLERKNQGCISVEMEVSAVQAFADLRGINLYTFIYGADNLDSTQWEKRILGNHSSDERIKYFLVARSIAVNI